jgi:hypothetical protein
LTSLVHKGVSEQWPSSPIDPVEAAAARASWRADEDEWTRAALESWQHRRTLHDVARECMHRGDRVGVTMWRTIFTGVLVAVGEDVCSLRTPDGRVDIRLPIDDAPLPFELRVVADAAAGGTRGDPVPLSFRTCLLGHEAHATEVMIGPALAGEVRRGRLVVGRDHVVLTTPGGDTTYLALASLAWVRAARD